MNNKQHIKYIHCRNHNNDGSINPNGGLTIAYVINSDFKVVGFAAAKCHNKDNYNKQIGRMKASGRLLSAQFYTEMPEIDEQTFINDAQHGYQKEFGLGK